MIKNEILFPHLQKQFFFVLIINTLVLLRYLPVHYHLLKQSFTILFNFMKTRQAIKTIQVLSSFSSPASKLLTLGARLSAENPVFVLNIINYYLGNV